MGGLLAVEFCDRVHRVPQTTGECLIVDPQRGGHWLFQSGSLLEIRVNPYSPGKVISHRCLGSPPSSFGLARRCFRGLTSHTATITIRPKAMLQKFHVLTNSGRFRHVQDTAEAGGRAMDRRPDTASSKILRKHGLLLRRPTPSDHPARGRSSRRLPGGMECNHWELAHSNHQ
jgi:hypothetical protein